MKAFRPFLFVLLFALVQQSYAQRGVRLAYIDMDEILENVEEYKTAATLLDKNVANWKKDIELKRNYLEKFLESGFPNRKQENWKFLDISQIIKKNIGELSFFNDYSIPNKIDSSIFVDGLEHNKIIFINGRI